MARKKKTKRSQTIPRPVKLMCSDCLKPATSTRWKLLRAARQRCEFCGGPLNKPSHVVKR